MTAVKLYDGGIECYWALMPRDCVLSGKRIMVVFLKHADYRLEQ